MKQLIHPLHRSPLKKRAILELIGLAVLITACINQREVISTAFQAIRQSDVFYLAALLMMYWLLLPISAINYRLLSGKPLSIFKTALVHLSGAGPGRIIPGGLGQLSVGVKYLHNSGLKLHAAILVAITNNLIGIITNLFLLAVALIVHPTMLGRIQDNLTGRSFMVIAFVVLAILMFLFLISHAKATKKVVRKINMQWSSLLRQLRHSPRKLFFIFLAASTITLGHTTMVVLSAQALSVSLSPVDALIALSAGVFIGGILPTPGGLGAVEAGMMSALVILGYGTTEATSIALLFRTATYWQPLLPGVLSYLYLREKKIL